MIEIKGLMELVIITLVIKLIVMQWYPPIQKSIQAILCIGIGSTLAYFINPSLEGIVTGIIGSGFAFYGEELITAFKGVTKNLDEETLEEVTRMKKGR